jgi:hypothetical protein
MSNARKSATLGMPHGTANGRLRKMILFDLLKRHNENICIRCNKPIECIDDLSIEHIKPWEGISAELFWDLNNIAFSHLVCNQSFKRPARSQPLRRIISPSGMAWCRSHKSFLPIENFSKHNQTWDGIRRDCRDCEKKYKDFIRYGKISEEDSVRGGNLV